MRMGLSRLKKYFVIMINTIESLTEYRLNFILDSVRILVPLIILVFLWRAVYQSSSPGVSIGGYNLSQMITYYIISRWLSGINDYDLDWKVWSDIKDGGLSAYLIRPIEYFHWYIASSVAAKIRQAIIGLFLITVFSLFVRGNVIVQSNPWVIVLFLLSVALSLLLNITIAFLRAITAFWFQESGGLVWIENTLISMMAGALVPLDLFPSVVFRIVRFMPFQALMYFPVSVYLGGLSRGALGGIVIQLLWLVFFFLAVKVIWARGIRRYIAAGG